MKTVAKKLALRLLPESVLHLVKKVHYARVVRSISPDEEPDLKVIQHLVAPGHYVADLGANIGVYTKYLSKMVGTSGLVYSVEPIPLTFDILRSNVRKLGLTNVELKNCAISDADGHVTMEVPRFDWGAENFYEARVVSEQAKHAFRRALVPCHTVDTLFSKLESPIRFIKCDVEGHELNCLRGAARTIQSSKPAWLIEVSNAPDDQKSTFYRTFCLLRESRYEAYWFDGAKLRVYRSGDKTTNHFFLRAEHLRVLRERDFPIQD